MWAPIGSASCAGWRSRATSDQPELSRAADRLAAVSRRQFAVDALEVRLDRVDGDVHLACNLGGGQHPRRVAEHFALTFAELIDDDGRHLRGGGFASRRQALAGAAGMPPAAARARDSTGVSLCSSHGGTDHPHRAFAAISAATVGWPSARSPIAAARQATALTSLSGLALRAAWACVSRLPASRGSLRSRCTQASATSAAGSGRW